MLSKKAGVFGWTTASKPFGKPITALRVQNSKLGNETWKCGEFFVVPSIVGELLLPWLTLLLCRRQSGRDATQLVESSRVAFVLTHLSHARRRSRSGVRG